MGYQICIFYFHESSPHRGGHFDSKAYPYIATALIKGKWNTAEYQKEIDQLAEEYSIDINQRGNFMIKLLILDVDGVMTDGIKYYDREGTVKLKTFCDKDWTAIKRFRAIGINVVFLTGDPYNVSILENRNLHVIANRGSGFHSDKKNYLDNILEGIQMYRERNCLCW